MPALVSSALLVAALLLHRRWGVGKRERDNGIVLLWSPALRKTFVSVGYGLEGVLPDARAGRIQDDVLIPTFRRGDFDAGVVATVRALASAAREEAYAGPPRVRTDGRTGPARDRSGRSDVDFFLSTLPFFAAWFGGVGLLAFTGFKVRRYRPRRCPNGHGSMRRLSESEDDARLAKEESFEETLGSVDYDVWVCAQCDAKRVLPYRKLWSKYETCPNCQRRTCAKLETITMKATYEREGERILRRKCKLCGYNVRERQVIPVLTHSGSSSSDWSSGGGGSSSSSDFGGGSSGGGGAGRSY